MVDNDLIRQNEEKYVALAEGIIGVLKSYGGYMTAKEVARELFTDSALVMLALTDKELGLPVIIDHSRGSSGDLSYKFHVS